MIPWGFGGGVVIAAIVYYFTGWVVLAWSGLCSECAKRKREDREFARMGGIISADGEYLGMEEDAWLRIVKESAVELIEQREQLDPAFDRGAVERWRSIHEAAAALLDGYDSGKYGYDPAVQSGDHRNS